MVNVILVFPFASKVQNVAHVGLSSAALELVLAVLQQSTHGGDTGSRPHHENRRFQARGQSKGGWANKYAEALVSFVGNVGRADSLENVSIFELFPCHSH